MATPPRQDGQIHELCGMILDITEHRTARLLLARSEGRLSLAVEASGLALFDWDIAGNRMHHSAQAAALRGAAAIEAASSFRRPKSNLWLFLRGNFAESEVLCNARAGDRRN